MAPSRNERDAREARDRLRSYSARQQVHEGQRTRRWRDNILAIVGVVVVAGLAAGTQIFYFTAGPGGSGGASASPSASASDQAGQNVGDVPDPSLAEDRDWTGTLTLNEIALGVTLDGKNAPQAVSSIVQDVQSNYYPGKTCHRLVNSDGFGVLQCGSLTGDGSGDPDFQYGPVENAPEDGVYPAGTIAMARSTSEYSMDHQFFICFKDTTLPTDGGGYTVVGTVTSGLDQLISGVVDGGIADGATDGAPNVATTITAFSLK
ncbi:peptidylprolyl isomerase [Schumannella sp. 10F1B-5-1]|uniref:peptidylprolyl isomerase n=1 Tax=Schumannella sp. 10F1B-5-1 TaxID=2590780 RepID=UPI00113011D9|nr:peptidylprolyl isomerase [Schumannella sp. 10F1B-5-1]TPW71052.1 peptidylprolyl isomerase [Schumannella sp. 10F1B-5-1]